MRHPSKRRRATFLPAALALFLLIFISPRLRAQDLKADTLPGPGGGAWLEQGSAAGTVLKEALLIGVGRHGSPGAGALGWDLPCVAGDLEKMRRTLEEGAAFRAFKVLEDDRATLSSIKGCLTAEIPARLGPGRNLLFIYYSGHGDVGLDGDPRSRRIDV